MGLPIHSWLDDTFKRIAGAMDGKLVLIHDLTEECTSFIIARILIDCFRWEPLQEWITVYCDGVDFEVYVKEFGAEVLSQQVHPNEKQGGEDAEFLVGIGSSETMAEPLKNSKEAEGTIFGG
ncbi:hypothetical protein PIB30_083964, partial [Stylosanthes scabra]|nr:hypothetical protein [Stylosanthes scabra]